MGLVTFKSDAQRHSHAEQMLLPDHLIEVFGAQAFRQGNACAYRGKVRNSHFSGGFEPFAVGRLATQLKSSHILVITKLESLCTFCPVR